MRFSIAKLLVAMLLLNVLVCLAFAAPAWVGYPILTLIALIIVPPIIIVGVVNTRGPRQAFFLGCMVAGLPHFIISLYMGVMIVLSYQDWSWATDDGTWIMQLTQVGGYFLGLLGGLSGVGAYYLLGCGEQQESRTREASPDEKDMVENFATTSDFGKTPVHALDPEPPLVRSPK